MNKVGKTYAVKVEDLVPPVVLEGDVVQQNMENPKIELIQELIEDWRIMKSANFVTYIHVQTDRHAD